LIDGDGQAQASEWEHKLSLFRQFVAQYKHARVPSGFNTKDYPGLGRWVSEQRKSVVAGGMAPDHLHRVAQLRAAGVLDPEFRPWEETYELLCKFVQVHGHTKVPVGRSLPAFPGLANWVTRQRFARRNMERLAAGIKPSSSHRISPERVALLDQLGFQWSGVEQREAWDRQWRQLQAFVAKYGNAHVPIDCSMFPGFERLGVWVAVQRKQHRRGALSAERTAKLEALGLPWEAGLRNPNTQKIRDERWQGGGAAARKRH
jgi:hypothetical protein